MKKATYDGKMVLVRQVKSAIGRNPKQRATLRGLGLRKINHVKRLQDTPEIRGMIFKVQDMVYVESAEKE